MKSKQKIEDEVEDLRNQAAATLALVAFSDADTVIKKQAENAAHTLRRMAESKSKKLAALVESISKHATWDEISTARYKHAVRCGEQTYLPLGRSDCMNLPSLLLRSALFSPEKKRLPLIADRVGSPTKTTIMATGTRLNDYDRRVFATCLAYYQAERSLASSKSTEDWVVISDKQFATDMGLTYGQNVRKAIRESLHRLSEIRLAIRHKKYELPDMKLVEVEFRKKSDQETLTRRTHSQDVIRLRVLDDMANIFSLSGWTALSKSGLKRFAGLDAWLASYYSTHSKPYKTPIGDLYKYSGSSWRANTFANKLKESLIKFQGDDVPNEFRVASFTIDATHVDVHLLRWSSGTE